MNQHYHVKIVGTHPGFQQVARKVLSNLIAGTSLCSFFYLILRCVDG